jgi:excisionase family DNA binding protein
MTKKAKSAQTEHRDDLRHRASEGPREIVVPMPTDSARPKREAPAAEPEPAFLSRTEVARLFGVSPSTVTRWARTGVLKAVRTPGGHYRFRAEQTRRAAGTDVAGELLRLD